MTDQLSQTKQTPRRSNCYCASMSNGGPCYPCETRMKASRAIVTEYWAKPIPLRQFDWAAHYDDPEGPTATGATEQEAIDNLLSDHPPCKNKSPYVRGDGGCLKCEADQGEACR